MNKATFWRLGYDDKQNFFQITMFSGNDCGDEIKSKIMRIPENIFVAMIDDYRENRLPKMYEKSWEASK